MNIAPVSNSRVRQVLDNAVWRTRRQEYLRRVEPWLADRLGRAARLAKHPVYDFLFEYYAFRPSHLARWSPGCDVLLEGALKSELDWPNQFRIVDRGALLPGEDFPSHRWQYLSWAIEYLESVARRPPQFGCFGLHEWAMVYRETEVRHNRVPLRLTRAETDAVVDDGHLVCTHFDAYRFFTPAATPRNRQVLTRKTAPQHDQPGCVHANMDLYKWAFQIAPFMESEIQLDAFEVAIAARELDMRASPYDLTAYGFTPIRIETRTGRDEYVEGQKSIARRAEPVRERLLNAYRRLADAL